MSPLQLITTQESVTSAFLAWLKQDFLKTILALHGSSYTFLGIPRAVILAHVT